MPWASPRPLKCKAALSPQFLEASAIQGFLYNPISIEIDSFKEDHSQIAQQMILADDDDHKRKLTITLVEEENADKVFVVCKTRAQCTALGQYLEETEVKADYTGPDKLKKSGKAVGAKNGKRKLPVPNNPAAKKRVRNTKNIGKGNRPRRGKSTD
jgi:superfamily II DNA/RNA helicase